VGDVLFGTGETHLRITRPEQRTLAAEALRQTLRPAGKVHSVPRALDRLGRVAERELEDRIEQALTEDLEDFVARQVESATGLEVRGRPRDRVRQLPEKWEKPYRDTVREEAHRFTHWWLRKRQRLALSRLATSRSPQEIDEARHRAPVWQLASGIS